MTAPALLAHGGADVAAPLEHGAPGRHQLIGFAFLVQIAIGAHLEQVQRILLRRIAAEYQHGQFRLSLADRAQGIDAALIGHGDIEQQHITYFAAGDIERFAPSMPAYATTLLKSLDDEKICLNPARTIW